MIEELKKIVQSKVLKNGIWLTVLQLANTVIPMLTIPYITRVLGTNEYGIFSIALNWILYLQVLVEFGFGLSGARKVSINDNNDSLQKLFDNIISARIVLMIFSFVIMNLICLISQFNLNTYLCMIVLFIMIVGTTFQLTWLFQGKQDMKFITIINTSARIVSVVLIFIFVKSEKDILMYCLLYGITLLLSSIISMIVARKKYGLKFHFSSKNEILSEIKEAKYLFASAAMTKIFGGFGITVLGIFSVADMAGIYSAIYKIPYILTMFFSPISQALYPYNSKKIVENFESGVKSVKKTGVPIFLVYAFVAIGIIVFRNKLVLILFGTDYSKYSIIVVPLVCQFLLGIVNNFIGIQVLVASGKQKEYSSAFVVSCVVLVVLNLLLGKFCNIYGVAIAALIGEAFLTVLLIVKYMGVKNKADYKRECTTI